MTYMLLSGKPPFDGRNEMDVFNKIRVCNYDFPEEDSWDLISDEAKEFISRLLKTNPDKRMTISEALEHPWIHRGEKSPACD